MMEMTSGELYEQLIRAGFQSGETVYKIYPSLEVKDLHAAQCGSTYSNPKPLRIEFCDKVALVVVQTVSSMFITDQSGNGGTPLGYYQHPNWNVEGWLLKSGFDQNDEIIRVRLHLEGFLGGKLDEGFMQVIPKRSTPGGPLILVDE